MMVSNTKMQYIGAAANKAYHKSIFPSIPCYLSHLHIHSFGEKKVSRKKRSTMTEQKIRNDNDKRGDKDMEKEAREGKRGEKSNEKTHILIGKNCNNFSEFILIASNHSQGNARPALAVSVGVHYWLGRRL